MRRRPTDAPPEEEASGRTRRRLADALPRDPWFWTVVALGAAARVYFIGFTQGTFDVHVVRLHGSSVAELGLLEYYRSSRLFNHPPLAGAAFAALHDLAVATGIPFRVVLRAPFACLDLGSALLLRQLLRGATHARWVFAGYWLNPLAILFSSYHGNTDSAVAFCCLLAVAAASRRRPAAAGAALGLGLGVKLPVAIACPALWFALRSWRERATLLSVTLGVALATALPAVLREPALLFERIVGYPGTAVTTPSGVEVWGLWNALGLGGTALARAAAANNALICGLPILLLAWLRRRACDARGLGASVGGSFLLLYGLTSFWAWQYLAWSLPFWWFLGPGFAATATALLGAYVWSAYGFFTGSVGLSGRWDFVHHAPWPGWLFRLRDASLLLCLIAGVGLLARAAVDERRARRRRAPA